jgi:drug/metabolite transporter (DMT)-like permease
MTMSRERLLAWGAFATVCLVWGTTYLGIRIAIETIPTFLLTGMRFTVAGSVLLAICRLAGQPLPRRRSDWLNLALIGFLLVGVGNVAVVWAEHTIPSGFAALLVATAPFWMAIIECFRPSGERLTRRKTIGMIVGFIGVAFLVAPDFSPSTFNRGFALGVVVLQIGSICWNLGSVRSKYHPIAAPPLVSAAVQMLSGGIICGLIGLAIGELPLLRFTPRSFGALLYLTIAGSIIAYGAYVYALSKLRTSTLSLYAYVNPVVAVILGWLILDEPLGVRAMVAMAVILSGVALVQSGGHKPRIVVAESDLEPAFLRRRAGG